jgi:hypothetical protein
MEDFPTTTLAPGYFNYDVSADGRSWFLGNAGGGNRALAVDFYSGGNSTGFVDYMYIPSLNLTGLASSTMNFKVASAPYSATPENDRVQVVVSTDCGATWTSVYDKAGAALNTAALTTSPFQPGVSSGANWRPETVDLTPYVNNANVLIAFKGTSGYGNYAWVDDININSVIGIEDAALANAVSVYPNPSNGVFTIEAGYGQTVGVHVLNQMGQEVVKSFEMNTATSTIDLSNQAAGTYFILINDGDKIASKKVTLTK